MTAESVVGPEGGAPEGLAMTVESRDIWLTNRSVSGRTVGEIREEADPGQARGIYLGGITRGVQTLPPPDGRGGDHRSGSLKRAGDRTGGSPRQLLDGQVGRKRRRECRELAEHGLPREQSA
jgi:hypothetical protein